MQHIKNAEGRVWEEIKESLIIKKFNHVHEIEFLFYFRYVDVEYIVQ